MAMDSVMSALLALLLSRVVVCERTRCAGYDVMAAQEVASSTSKHELLEIRSYYRDNLVQPQDIPQCLSVGPLVRWSYVAPFKPLPLTGLFQGI